MREMACVNQNVRVRMHERARVHVSVRVIITVSELVKERVPERAVGDVGLKEIIKIDCEILNKQPQNLRVLRCVRK